MLHSEAFEALLAARNLLKRDVAAEAGLSPQFVSDLLAHRGGASRPVARRLSGVLGVDASALFPELADWIAPLPSRDGKREKAVA